MAVTVMNGKPSEQTCSGMELVIKDSIDYGFISKREVLRLLNSKKLSPIGKPMGEINTRQLEDELRQHPLIGNAECYRTSSNRVGIEITQRLPILRVMAANGENYYIDDKGHTMPGGSHAAHLPIATGNIDKKMAEGSLYQLALLISEDDFWKRQVEQINITPEGEIELVPQVGDHILFLGKPVHIEEKLERIRTFYTKGLSRVGWNKYSRISVEFDNQVICKRHSTDK